MDSSSLSYAKSGAREGVCITENKLCWKNNSGDSECVDVLSIHDIDFKKSESFFGMNKVLVDGKEIDISNFDVALCLCNIISCVKHHSIINNPNITYIDPSRS